MNLDFLNNISLDPVADKKKPVRKATPKLPENADLRVFKSGKIYPSKAFATEYEYRNKDSQDKGYALDVFDSQKWGMIAGKLPQELIFVAKVPKGSAKADLFNSCKYDDQGEPKSSVLTQGGGSFGETFKEMLTRIYNVDWDITEYVDLNVDTEHQIKSPNQIYFIPKVVSRGANKGKEDYIRRELVPIYPLVVVEEKRALISEDDIQQEDNAPMEMPVEEQTENMATFDVGSSVEEEPQGDPQEDIPTMPDPTLSSEDKDVLGDWAKDLI